MMTSGGHGRSGPTKDPNALRRDRDNFTLRALPRAPYDGEVPAFPLPEPQMMETINSGESRPYKEFSQALSNDRRDREAALWEWAWQQPQAHVWAQDAWRWLDVAMWVRTQAVCEAMEATAADKNSLHRFADKIGLSPVGLKENGWSIAAPDISSKPAEPIAELPTSAKARLRAAQ
jgi:hypothetical protein